jgi:hypothetical protein
VELGFALPLVKLGPQAIGQRRDKPAKAAQKMFRFRFHFLLALNGQIGSDVITPLGGVDTESPGCYNYLTPLFARFSKLLSNLKTISAFVERLFSFARCFNCRLRFNGSRILSCGSSRVVITIVSLLKIPHGEALYLTVRHCCQPHREALCSYEQM